MNYREKQIRQLALNDPVVRAHVAYYDSKGSCSWEQAMTLTVFALAQEAKSLRKLAEKMALTEATAPKTFVIHHDSRPPEDQIKDDMKQFYDTCLGVPFEFDPPLPTKEGKRLPTEEGNGTNHGST